MTIQFIEDFTYFVGNGSQRTIQRGSRGRATPIHEKGKGRRAVVEFMVEVPGEPTFVLVRPEQVREVS